MSDDLDRSVVRREQEAASAPKSAEFQEVPGEADADAVQQAFVARAASNPSTLVQALSAADSATRARVVSRLQQDLGNAAVRRALEGAPGSRGRMVGMSQPDMVDEVQRRKGTGQPLPEGTRHQMEGFFGADLSGVKVHANSEAAELNRELNAQAFTVGSEIFVSEGRYDPSSTAGQGLLAHEMTHVGQQGGIAPAAQRQGEEEEVQTKPELQRAPEEEEEVQTKAELQRAPEEEEEVQTKAELQRAPEEEEEVQTKAELQRAPEEEEEVQTKRL